MKSVYIIWRDHEGGMWHPVAKLTYGNNTYRLNYTKGAAHKNFIPFPRMDDKSLTYMSTELFSFFKNRMIPPNRPEFKKMLQWSDLSNTTIDELTLISTTGGSRKTDQFRIIPQPEMTHNGQFKVRFFVNGISHLNNESLERLSLLKEDDPLQLILEDDNEHDCNAIVIASDNKKGTTKVGYCPKYFNCDFRALLKNPKLHGYSIHVVKVNSDAPAQFKLLCEFVSVWPEGFIPMVSQDYLAYASKKQA
ncbi:TPA: HIRAN domain-containing protein [Photobacterium damselae]